MGVIKCKMCGGDLNIPENSTVAECEYCGSVQTVPITDGEKKVNLFARANRLRLACEFDKATGVYENIVAEFPEEAEAYWGLVLCRYGIEYVDDPRTGKKIPTCHRSSFDSIMEDSDFEQVLENADVVARRVYRGEAKAIEELRKGILEVSSKEDPYDIFICYKETDENGNRTIDSVIAQDVYDVLTEKGYRVFFSRVSLEDKLGTEYEPYIFAALNSAKVMLAFGTDYEYYNAVWVRNEWSRFLALIAAGKKKALIPCYKGIDAYDMPKEFAKLQAQDMGKVGAIQDLLRGIEKILEGDTGKTQINSLGNQLKVQAMSQADNTVRLGIMSVSSGDLQRGIHYFEEALKTNADHVGAYLGLVWSMSIEHGKPYCNRLEAFPLDEISEYIKENPELLSSAKASLLANVIANTNSVDLVRALLESGAYTTDTHEYALYQAIRSKKRNKFVPLLLEYGANPNQEYNVTYNNNLVETHTALADVIWEANDVSLTKLLIDHQANVNYAVRDNNDLSWSLLDLAVRKNNEQIVQLLLENDADANSGRWYNRPIWYPIAAGWGAEKVFYCVLSDAIWNAKNMNIMRMLLEHGANPNYKYTDYESPTPQQRSGLYDVICFGESREMLTLMLDFGADIATPYIVGHSYDDDFRKMSMLDLAIKKGKQEMADTLREYINKKETAARNAIRKQQLEDELTSLRAEYPQIKGLFADSRRKKMGARIDEIEKELKELGGE